MPFNINWIEYYCNNEDQRLNFSKGDEDVFQIGNKINHEKIILKSKKALLDLKLLNEN